MCAILNAVTISCTLNCKMVKIQNIEFRILRESVGLFREELPLISPHSLNFVAISFPSYPHDHCVILMENIIAPKAHFRRLQSDPVLGFLSVLNPYIHTYIHICYAAWENGWGWCTHSGGSGLKPWLPGRPLDPILWP